MRRPTPRNRSSDDENFPDYEVIRGSNVESTPLLVAERAPQQTSVLGDRFSSFPPVETRVEEDPYDASRIFFSFFFPAIGGLLYGFDIGMASMELMQLTDSMVSGIKWSQAIMTSTALQGLIISAGTIGALAGSLICWKIADDIGRKRSLIIAAALYIVGAYLQFISGSPVMSLAVGITILVIGSFIYGIACGFSMHGAPAYISEIAPTAIRGILVSMKEAFVVLGMVVGYVGGYILENTVGGWRFLNLFAVGAGAVMIVGMHFLPDSPRWLSLKGKPEEALDSYRFTHPTVLNSAIIPSLCAPLKSKPADRYQSTGKADEDKGWFSEYFNCEGCYANNIAPLTTSQVRRAIIAGMGLVILQQATGQPSVLYYADDLFSDMGVGNVAAVCMSVLKLVMTLLSTLAVDNYGRKVLLHIGIVCMMLGLTVVIISASFFPEKTSNACADDYSDESTCNGDSMCTWDPECDTSCTESGYADNTCTCCNADGLNLHKVITITGLGIYIAGYQVGFGPITWLIISEIFPLHTRGKAISAAIAMNFLVNALISFLFPSEYKYLGEPLTFGIYLLLLAISFIFVSNYVPETRGLSLEEIEEMLNDSSETTRSRNDSMDSDSIAANFEEEIIT